MKRETVGLAISVLMVVIGVAWLMILSCPSAGAMESVLSPNDLADPITIIYWHPYHGVAGQAMQRMISEFNANNPYDITVQGEFSGAYNDIYNSVIAGLRSGGSLPNVVVAYPGSFADFARYDAVRFLDDYLDDPILGISDIADFHPGVLDYYRLEEYGNQLAGIQYGRSIELMYYNADLLSSAGSTIPATWDAFETACINLTTETVSGTIPSLDTSFFATLLWSRRGELLSEDNNYSRFHQQPGIESLLLFQQLINDGYARLERGAYEQIGAFGNGEVGLVFGSSSVIPYYHQSMEAGVNNAWGVTHVPAVSGHEVVDSYGAGAGILHESENKDRASWIFIRWLTEMEQTARWAAMSGYLPVRVSAGTHISMSQKLATDAQYAQAYNLLPLGRGEPGIRGYDDMRQIVDNAIISILQYGANVNDTLQAAAAEVDLLLAASGPDSAVIPPAGGMLVYTNTQGLSATVEFPAGAVAVTQTVSYVPVNDLPTSRLAFALVPDLTFGDPVTITIHYRDADVEGMDEDELKLFNYGWTSGRWVDVAPCGGYSRDPLNNILEAGICHFSDYVLADRFYAVHLPVVLKNWR